jgi:DNA helicase II / ATP-dependent DNA helicase PcrA
VPARPSPTVAFAPGDRVFHDKFGYGHVRAVEAGKLDVEFTTGRKKVMDSFVRRA